MSNVILLGVSSLAAHINMQIAIVEFGFSREQETEIWSENVL